LLDLTLLGHRPFGVESTLFFLPSLSMSPSMSPSRLLGFVSGPVSGLSIHLKRMT